MRTLGEIIEATKDGEKPTYDELYYSLLALSGLLNMASRDIDDMSDPEKPDWSKKWHWQEKHRRHHAAYNTDPKSYMGDSVPGNPEYDSFRNWGKNLLDHIVSKEGV